MTEKKKKEAKEAVKTLFSLMKTGKTSRDIMTRKVINMSNTAIPLSFCVFIYLWTKVFDILCTVSLSVNHPGHLQ